MRRALVVDVRTANRDLLRALLVGHGLEVDEASDGADALARARRHPPDVVITEVHMPVMDGYTMLRHWKADPRLRTIPVVFYTAAGAEVDAEALAVDLGADAFIATPAAPAALVARVEDVVGRYGAAGLEPPRHPSGDPAALLERYGQVVHRKLASRTLELEAANRELAERSTRLRTIVDTEPECVKLLGADGSVLEMNPAGLRLIEADSFEQVSAKCVFPLVVEEHRDAFRALVANVFAGETGTLDFEIVGIKGGRRWLSTTSTPLRDATGAVTALLGITRDITKRKQDEDELRANEARFRAICEASPVGIFLVREDGYVTYRNPADMRMTGLAPEETVGVSWAKAIHPDDRAQVVADWQASLTAGRPYAGTGRYLHDDGTVVWWDLATAPIHDGATLLGFVGMVVDITERKRGLAELERHEARFRALIEGAADLIAVIDARGAVVYTSPSCHRVLDLSPAELASRPATEFVHPHDVAAFAAAIQHAEHAPLTAVPFLARLRHRDGSWRRMDAVARSIPAQSPDGFIVVNARDVTERHALEQQLAQAHKLQAIGTLAAGIAHDFNNILAAILGNAELARRDLDAGHPAAESVRGILSAGQRAKDLVRRILLFSRPQEQDLTPIQVGPVVDETVKLLRSTLPAGVELRLEVASDLPLVRADALQLNQVVFNLATNAWHALNEQRGRIDLRLEACRVDRSLGDAAALRPGPYVRLSVRDNGEGIDATTLGRIFEPFFTTKPPGQGTGLGLSVVHGIVTSHGGTILVDSEPGRGTTFHVYLPASPDDAEPTAAEPALVMAPPGHGAHILYIDDEAPLVALAVRALTRMGYRVTAETHPAQAIELFRANPRSFDIVITDLNMPGMSGLDVARHVMAIQPDTAVVLLSGYLAAVDLAGSAALGVREVVLKPTSFAELGNVVHRLARPAS